MIIIHFSYLKKRRFKCSKKNSRYAHDEETILYLIWKEKKDLFCNIQNK